MAEPVSVTKKAIVTGLFALIGWAACGAIMGAGMGLFRLSTALIVHAVGGPVVFILLSVLYFTKFNYTSPLATAVIFVAVVILADVLIVALLIEKSFAMFRGFIGTWLVFILVFLVTWLTGTILARRKKNSPAGQAM